MFDVKKKIEKSNQHVFPSEEVRWNANDATKKQRIETDQLASLPAQTAYRV